MFFFKNQFGCHTVHGRTLRLRTPLPPTPFKPSNCLANLLRLGLLGIYTGELVSPYFDYCITFFIHILKWVRLNYAITHHHPAPPTTTHHQPKYIHTHPPPSTTTHHQPKYVHYHSPPLTTTYHQPKYIHIHPRPVKMYPPSFTTTHRQPRLF